MLVLKVSLLRQLSQELNIWVHGEYIVTTPTQPQHNLNLVGFDTIIAVHTTTTTTPPTHREHYFHRMQYQINL